MTIRTERGINKPGCDAASLLHHNFDCCINGQLLNPVPCKVDRLEHGCIPAAYLAVIPRNLIAAI